MVSLRKSLKYVKTAIIHDGARTRITDILTGQSAGLEGLLPMDAMNEIDWETSAWINYDPDGGRMYAFRSFRSALFGRCIIRFGAIYCVQDYYFYFVEDKEGSTHFFVYPKETGVLYLAATYEGKPLELIVNVKKARGYFVIPEAYE